MLTFNEWMARNVEMETTTLYIKREPFKMQFFTIEPERLNFGPILTPEILEELFHGTRPSSDK